MEFLHKIKQNYGTEKETVRDIRKFHGQYYRTVEKMDSIGHNAALSSYTKQYHAIPGRKGLDTFRNRCGFG